MGHNGTNDTRETRSYNRPKFNKQMKISKKILTNPFSYLVPSQILPVNQPWTATKRVNAQKHQNILRDSLFTKLESIMASDGKLIDSLSFNMDCEVSRECTPIDNTMDSQTQCLRTMARNNHNNRQSATL